MPTHILSFLAGFFLFSNKSKTPAITQTKNPATISATPENPKQGDTVFIKVKGDSGLINGYFDQKKMVFFKIENSYFIQIFNAQISGTTPTNGYSNVKGGNGITISNCSNYEPRIFGIVRATNPTLRAARR